MFKIVAILVSLLSLGCMTEKQQPIPTQFSWEFEKKWRGDWKMMEGSGTCWNVHEGMVSCHENPTWRETPGLRIDLSDMGLQDDDIKDLVEAMREGHFRNLEILDLACNDIGDAGAKALANALNQDFIPNVKRIWLRNNKIGDKGKLALVLADWKLQDHDGPRVHHGFLCQKQDPRQKRDSQGKACSDSCY